jgi:serine/threonine protein kinase
LYTTEALTSATNPAISGEIIWTTGEVPAEIGVTFETHQRPVWIKFTKNASGYSSEIDCRVRLGVSVDDDTFQGTGRNVIPILQHFNAISSERKVDKDYNIDRIDDRFKSLNLITGNTSERNVQILLNEYPYVIVYPAPLRGTLYDYFLKHGISQASECKQIMIQLLTSLGLLHSNEICHGNISMRNIVSFDSHPDGGLCWGFLNLSYASFTNESCRQYLGGIDSKGFALYETETLPPEMFMKVTANDLKQYLDYWAVVERRFNVRIDRSLINPVVDIPSGSMYIVKCHFAPLTQGENDIPLPYKLLQADASSDFWALGQLLFAIQTGRNLFQVSPRDGRLFDYERMCNWDGYSMIYEHIEDEVMQDVLLLCLSLAETRKHLNAAHKRQSMKKFADTSEQSWLDGRSTTINCWELEILMRFHHSPTETVKHMTLREMTIPMPCSFLLLPFDIFDVTSGNNNFAVAERIGIELLKLSKVCIQVTSIMDGQ